MQVKANINTFMKAFGIDRSIHFKISVCPFNKYDQIQRNIAGVTLLGASKSVMSCSYY